LDGRQDKGAVAVCTIFLIVGMAGRGASVATSGSSRRRPEVVGVAASPVVVELQGLPR
jgi:hypothetical protein